MNHNLHLDFLIKNKFYKNTGHFKVGTDCSGIEAPIIALKLLNINFSHEFSCDNDKFIYPGKQYANHGSPGSGGSGFCG